MAQRPPEHLHAREPIEWDVHVVSDLRVPLLGVQVTARLVAEHAEQRFGWDGDVGADECVRIGRISTTAPTVGGPLRLVLELHGTDANGDKLYHKSRQSVTFPLADALCWLLAARQFILDIIELEQKGGANPALAGEIVRMRWASRPPPSRSRCRSRTPSARCGSSWPMPMSSPLTPSLLKPTSWSTWRNW